MTITQDSAEKLARALIDRFGLELTAVPGQSADGPFVEFRPRDVHPNEGFVIRVTVGWRSVNAQFVPGQWAASLLAEMGSADKTRQAIFLDLAAALTSAGGKIKLLVNDLVCDPLQTLQWPRIWSQMHLSLEFGPLVVDQQDSAAVKRIVLQSGGGLLGLIATLLPLEEVEIDPESESQSLPEGAKTRIEVNRYERSRLNRALCIAIHGYKCTVCGFDFSKEFGELGQDFIHIHHVVPISKMGAGYLPNPSTDLVPLCPNCHAMIHRKVPPLAIDDLRAIIRAKSN